MTLVHRKTLFTWLQALAAFSPAIVMAWLISQNAVNTLVWDDWERVPIIQKFREGTLTFRDLYAPHIDHRILFPRIIMLACNELGGGDVRWEITITFLMVLAAAIGVWRLAHRTVFGGATLWGVVFVSNVIIFSPIQWDNWLWSIQLAFMMPMTFTVWALVVCVQKWRWWIRLLVAAALALIGTHSFGHGFAVWPAVFGLALLLRDFAATGRERWLFLICWALLGSATVGCYALLDFKNTSDATHSYMQSPGEAPPSVVHRGRVLEEPMRAAHMMAILAGNPFSRLHLVDPSESAQRIGWCLIAAFCILGIKAITLFRRGPEWWDRALPWLALGCAALLGMAAITIGRLNLGGFARAACTRYGSISMYLSVSVLLLAVLWWRESSARLNGRLKETWGVALLAVFVGFMIPAWNYGTQIMQLCRDGRLQGHAALLFVNFLTPEFVWRIDSSIDFPKRQANILDGYGLLKPALAKSLELGQFSVLDRPRPTSQSQVTRFEHVGDNTILASGYARVEGRPADLVLFTWETAQQKPLIFTYAEPNPRMVEQIYWHDLDLVGRLPAEKDDYCKWEKRLPLEQTGLGTGGDQEVKIRAWVFDVTRPRAFRIAGEWTVNRAGQVIAKEQR